MPKPHGCTESPRLVFHCQLGKQWVTLGDLGWEEQIGKNGISWILQLARAGAGLQLVWPVSAAHCGRQLQSSFAAMVVPCVTVLGLVISCTPHPIFPPTQSTYRYLLGEYCKWYLLASILIFGFISQASFAPKWHQACRVCGYHLACLEGSTVLVLLTSDVALLCSNSSYWEFSSHWSWPHFVQTTECSWKG